LLMRITGSVPLLLDCRMLDVTYSSSCSGKYTQASWKKGLRDVSADESSSECVGSGPMIAAKSMWYCAREMAKEGCASVDLDSYMALVDRSIPTIRSNLAR
jgi:hypothetical protein